MGREAGRGRLAGPETPSHARPRPLTPLRMARLRQEAREQERRQAEEEARQAREAQAWVQLKEREVLQLQVGRVSRGWGCRPRTPPVPRVLRAARWGRWGHGYIQSWKRVALSLDRGLPGEDLEEEACRESACQARRPGGES